MRKLMKTKVWSLVLALGLALGLAPVAGAQSNDPAAALAAFEKVAFGSTQDLDAALALFSDNATLTVTPAPAGTSGVWNGKEEIRKGLQYNKQQNVMRVNTGSPKVEGTKATTNAKVTNNFFQMIGVGAVEHTTEVVVEGGKIKSYTSTMLAAEQARVASAAKAFQAANPAPQSASLPSAGLGQQAAPSSTASSSLNIPVGLVATGLFSLIALFFVQRRVRQPK